MSGTIIYPLILKNIHDNIKKGEENEWKKAAGIMRTVKCLKIEKALLPSITASYQLCFPQAFRIMPDTEQCYQIILGQDVIRATQMDANVEKGMFKYQDIIKPMPKHVHWMSKQLSSFCEDNPKSTMILIFLQLNDLSYDKDSSHH